MNFRIQKVDTKGRPLQSIGSIGNVTGSFSRPKGVATDSEGNLYVVDALFDNIQIFDKQGRFLMHWGEGGIEPGYFWLPTGIAIDVHDRIWVADTYNRRIQVFKRMDDHEEN
jgi:sugar lactone lactonase YvrE